MAAQTAQHAIPSSVEFVGPVPLLSGALAAAVACAVPFVQAISSGWPALQTLAYLCVSLVFILWVMLPAISFAPARVICERPLVFLFVGGLIGLLLQSLSGDPFVQPIVFTVLFVHAALLFGGALKPTFAVGMLYLGLMALGQLVHGWRDPGSVFGPVVAYIAPLGFLYAFTQLSIHQAQARQRADMLAADLAHERDYLARLVGIHAALVENLDLEAVLRQTAASAGVLAQAGQVRLWLHEAAQEQPVLRLAASHPPNPNGMGTEPDQHLLLATEPSNTGQALVLPLLFGGENIGALELGQPQNNVFGEGDVEQLRPFAHAAAIAIHNARLYHQAQLSATLAERNRLARELHDTIAQGLTAITMQLEAAQRSFERDPERTRSRLVRAHGLGRATLEDVRRSVWTLASPLIEGNTLSQAINEQCAQFTERTGIRAIYTHAGPIPLLDHAKASQLLRIVQEALHNVEKHARAGHVAVRSETTSDTLHITVCDDGVGFDTSASSMNAGAGFGMTSMGERARLAGGILSITSTPNEGTEVSIDIRYDSVEHGNVHPHLDC